MFWEFEKGLVYDKPLW